MNYIDLGVFYADGVALISRKSLATLLAITPQQIISYEKPSKYKDPLVRSNSNIGNKKTVYYDMLYAIDWYKRNVKHKHSKKKDFKSYVEENINIENMEDEEFYREWVENLPRELQIAFTKSNLDELEKFVKLEDIVKKQIDNKIKKGEYLSKDDSDRALIEMINMLKEVMIQIEDRLPTELKNKFKNIDTNIVEKIINSFFIKIMEEMKEKAKEFKVVDE